MTLADIVLGGSVTGLGLLVAQLIPHDVLRGASSGATRPTDVVWCCCAVGLVFLGPLWLIGRALLDLLS